MSTTQDKIQQLAELEEEVERIAKGELLLYNPRSAKYSIEIYFLLDTGEKAGERKLLFITDDDIMAKIILAQQSSLNKQITLLKKEIREGLGVQ